MNNIYYQLWVDAIVNSKDYKEKKPGWKASIFKIITAFNTMNLFTICLWLRLYGVFTYLIEIDIFPGTRLNDASSMIIQFASPFILLNYFLIFHRDRYKKLIGKYRNSKGRLTLMYCFISGVVFIISLTTYYILY